MNWHTIQGRTTLTENDATRIINWLNTNLQSSEFDVHSLERIRSTPETPYNYWLLKIAFTSDQYIQMDQDNLSFYYEPWNDEPNSQA